MAAAVAAWLLVYETLLKAVDARLTLPGTALAHQAHPRFDPDSFARIVEGLTGHGLGGEFELGLAVLYQNDDRKRLSQTPNEDWLDNIPFVAYLPSAEEIARLPNRPPGPWEEDRRGPRKDRDKRRDDRDRGGPPPPKRGRGPGIESLVERWFDGRGPDRRDGRGPRGRDGRGPGRRFEVPAMLRPKFFTVAVEGTDWRIGAFGGRHHTVFAGVTLDQFDADVRMKRRYFLMAIPLGFLLSAGAGWLVAGKAVRPVERITEMAEHVTAKGLDERVRITGHEDQEFARLVNVINGMMERLERSFHQSARFSADASHELKTPLAVMRGEIERGLQECAPGSAEEQRFLDLAEEVHRLKQITENLLVLSRADSGSLRVEKQVLSLSELVTQFSEDVEILCEQASLSFQADIAPDVIISADRGLLLSVLHNLASNAVKYNREDGEVKCIVRELENNVVIEFHNTGPGIPESQQDKIFDRFYRADEARSREVDGFGLGLNIAAEITRANGGELILLGSDENWTRFAVVFPQS